MMCSRALPAFASAWLACIASAGAQEMRTEGPCSPVVERTQGNVTINFTGGCTGGLTAAQLKEIKDAVLASRAVPAELLDRYDQISRQFGVTDAAVSNFFRILGEKKVAAEDLDAKLREVAASHLTLLKQTEAQAGDDPQVAALKKQAVAAIDKGDYAQGQVLLQQAFDADLVAARKALDAANQRYLTAAKTKADLGRLKLAQLQYAAAAQEFQTAADLVPAGQPLIRASYLSESGYATYLAGNNALALAALTEALRLREQAIGPDDIRLAANLRRLGRVYWALGRPAEAEPFYRRALELIDKGAPTEPQRATRYVIDLSRLYRALGRDAEADALDDRVLAMQGRLRSRRGPQAASRLHALSIIFALQGDRAEAERLLRRALEIHKSTLGPDHPDTASVMHDLAQVLYIRGRYEEAEPLYQRSLLVIEKVLGPEHPRVALYLGNLARQYEAQGRLDEVEPLLKRALAIDEKALGPEHPRVARILNYLAQFYKARGRLDEAQSLDERALAIAERRLGPDNPTTQMIRNHLESLPAPAGVKGVVERN
jgi:tetratricopeptide (TPR) repeat protein